MKKAILFLGAFCCFLIANAQNSEGLQFTVETTRGIPIKDGSTFSFDQSGNGNAVLAFGINNFMNYDIPIQIRVLDIINAVEVDGERQGNLQLCFGECYTPVSLGEVYPTIAQAVTPGLWEDREGSGGNYFMNLAYNNGEVIKYKLMFFQPGRSGEIVGNTVTVTYVFDPTLSIDESNKLGVSVYPTVVKDVLHVDTPAAMRLKLYNLQGKLLRKEELEAGDNAIYLADLPSQLYLVQIENEYGQTQTNKVVIQ